MTYSVIDIEPTRKAAPPQRGEAAWAQMHSGRPFPLTEPSPADVWFPDIAAALGKLCRFTGHCQLHYSVAQHCLIVAEQLPPEWRAYGLLHDAHEAMMGDISQPMKQALRHLGGGDALRLLETAIDRAIYAAAGLPWPLPPAIREAVAQADLVALATERRDVLAPSRRPWQPLPDPLRTRIKPQPWPEATERYLDALDTYVPAAAVQARTQGSV